MERIFSSQTITSKQNHHVQRFRSLRTAKGRASDGCFLVEGWNLLREALENALVDTIIVDESRKPELAKFSVTCANPAAIFCAPSFILEYICETKTPQGVVASVPMPGCASLDALSGSVLALDGVQDPGNVGTMIRTAEAAGFNAVLLSPECADPFAPKTVRATMGSLFRMPLLRGSLLQSLPTLQSRGFGVISAELHGAPVAAVLKENPKHFSLVIGSEGNGVCKSVSKLSNFRVSLPMRGNVESLNAAVAAGILMYALSFLRGDPALISDAK